MFQNSKSFNHQHHAKQSELRKKKRPKMKRTHHSNLMLLPEKGMLQQENLHIPAQKLKLLSNSN